MKQTFDRRITSGEYSLSYSGCKECGDTSVALRKGTIVLDVIPTSYRNPEAIMAKRDEVVAAIERVMPRYEVPETDAAALRTQIPKLFEDESEYPVTEVPES